ncbi:MAG TPA: hypothetical protein PLD20_19645 [Blastocatellia bacterium]|nr:hypothetical protein [Blastocatellia bacterium]HMV86378.1 hypothetical protein [Blastocatellia bacterium]HMX25504.1 hypothetical protein [Blastocatellia bacterium]HMY71955.1 hypothetical protein [Blastocatellia bacterium]HMZ20162.1 hypothetical protein [Blastocatellia bacterium]
MQKFLIVIALMMLFVTAALADTLYLKNGSVLKGTFVGFENNQFIFELTNGNRLKFRPTEVDRLVMERDAVAGTGAPIPGRPSLPSRDTNPSTGNTGGNTGGARWETLPAFDVRLEDQWIRSTIQVTNGQRIRVDATGTVSLEGRTQTGPEGISGRRDRDAPLPNENDGALIAAIGQDSPPILIGRSREFVADHDGVLYFTVNHWETANARGQFRLTVAVDRNSGGAIGGGSGSGNTGSRPNQGRQKTVTVSATQQWTDTGIDVEPNMTFEITAEGEIEISSRTFSRPDGNRDANVRASTYPLQNEGVGALIGKIRYRDGRDSNSIFIGSRSTPGTEPGEYGRLFLGINDDYFRDNRGQYTVTIRW